MPAEPAIFDTNFLLLFAVAIACVAGVIFSASSLGDGIARLKLIHNVLGILLVVGAAAVGLLLFAYGFLSGAKEFVYLSLLPLVGAMLAFMAVTRRHRTWYGFLGFPDHRARLSSYWNETRSLWGSVLGGPTAADTNPAASSAVTSHHGPQPASEDPYRALALAVAGARRKGGVAKRVADFVSSRLPKQEVAASPDMLELSVAMLGRGTAPVFVGERRPRFLLRRENGGMFRPVVASDVPFLSFSVGHRQSDGAYPVEIDLVPQNVTRGKFVGAIDVEIADPIKARLAIPLLIEVG